MTENASLRIGELARRTGVSTDLLRAWERRYRLLEPARSAGGFRLYGPDDERRVLAMRRHLERGLAAAEAARLARAGEGPATRAAADGGPLLRTLLAFDEPAAQAELDRLFGAFTIEAALETAVLPALREIGERWSRGEATVAQEHFATGVVRGRLLGLSRGWARGGGPHALLACAPGELHDVGLLAFGVALRGQGWRVTYLGADTPVATLVEAASLLEPDAVVVAALERERFERAADELAGLASRRRLALGGLGAEAGLASRIGAELLPPEASAAAAAL